MGLLHMTWQDAINLTMVEQKNLLRHVSAVESIRAWYAMGGQRAANNTEALTALANVALRHDTVALAQILEGAAAAKEKG